MNATSGVYRKQKCASLPPQKGSWLLISSDFEATKSSYDHIFKCRERYLILLLIMWIVITVVDIIHCNPNFTLRGRPPTTDLVVCKVEIYVDCQQNWPLRPHDHYVPGNPMLVPTCKSCTSNNQPFIVTSSSFSLPSAPYQPDKEYCRSGRQNEGHRAIPVRERTKM